MISLAITTSTATVGVSVGSASEILATEQMLTDRRHAEELTPMIQRVLAGAEMELRDLSRLVVDVGPGRFTGLRVGLATVRTLALVLDKQVVPLTSLEILAAAEETNSVLAVVDARRGEVFQQHFSSGIPVSEPLVGAPQALLASKDTFLQPKDHVAVGDGVDRYPELYGAAAIIGRQVQADQMIRLAELRPARPGVKIAPLYLREPDVNLNIKTRPQAG